MTDLRIGQGYDVHRLTDGRALILGGEAIPYAKGLAGHSDADVLLHAVMDALLGAAALGDIGDRFPDSAAEFRGISSLILLRRVAQLRRGIASSTWTQRFWHRRRRSRRIAIKCARTLPTRCKSTSPASASRPPPRRGLVLPAQERALPLMPLHYWKRRNRRERNTATAPRLTACSLQAVFFTAPIGCS